MHLNISLLTMRFVEQRKVSHIPVEIKVCRRAYLQCHEDFPILGISDIVPGGSTIIPSNEVCGSAARHSSKVQLLQPLHNVDSSATVTAGDTASISRGQCSRYIIHRSYQYNNLDVCLSFVRLFAKDRARLRHTMNVEFRMYEITIAAISNRWIMASQIVIGFHAWQVRKLVLAVPVGWSSMLPPDESEGGFPTLQSSCRLTCLPLLLSEARSCRLC